MRLLTVDESAPQAKPRLDYALQYVAHGFAVVPLWWCEKSGKCGCGNAHDGVGKNLSSNSRGKHPHTMFAPHGSLSASKDVDTVRRWFTAEPRLSIGIATGEVSGIVAVDIDPRDGGDVTWEDFVDRNGGHVPDTVIADTGGGGEHILFRYQADQVVRSPGKGIQIKGNGGYIVVEPSHHHAGRAYSWRAECDPLDGFKPADAPKWLLSPKSADLLKPVRGGGHLTGSLDPQRIADLHSALKHLDPDPYDPWYQTGMALHSTDAPEAFEIWDAWSQGSPKYSREALILKWHSFNQGNGLNVESIFAWAYENGWPGDTERVATPVDQVRVARSFTNTSVANEDAADMGLLEIPGALGEVVRLANATAPKPQPVFAVSSALALGSVVAGRRYRAQPRSNWSSMYFVNVGKSASGKEYGRTIIDAVLTAAEWPELIGRSGYTSDSAVISSLLLQPSHIAMIDEIGAMLEGQQAEGAYMQRAATTSLIECWGNLHGTVRPKAYSTMTIQKDQAEAMLKRVIYNPALSLLGMSTPRKFYGALNNAAVEGGFLSRLMVIDTDIGRRPMGNAVALNIPQSIIDWCHACRDHLSRHGGNLAHVPPGADTRPTPTDVPTDSAAIRAFAMYEIETLDLMDELEEEGLAELEGRSVEKAMRIALILAVSVDPVAPRITGSLAGWAINYVRYWSARLVKSVRDNVHDSKFGQWQSWVFTAVVKIHEKNRGQGATDREILRSSRQISGLDMRQRKMAFDALSAAGKINFAEIPHKNGRGRPRKAWVPLDLD